MREVLLCSELCLLASQCFHWVMMSLRTYSCCPRGHIKESEHVSCGSSCPQNSAVSCELTPQGLSLRSIGYAGLGQHCAESWKQSLLTVSLIVNKGTVWAPLADFSLGVLKFYFFWYQKNQRKVWPHIWKVWGRALYLADSKATL